MKHVKGYVEFISESTLVNEGLMGDVHQLVKDTKSIEDFVKAFFKEYGDKIKQDKKSEEWVRGLYKDSSINETKVSLRVGEPLIYDGSKGIFKGWGSPGKTVHIEVDDELIEVPAKEIRKDPNYKYSTASSHGIAIAENVLFEAMDVSDDLKKVSTIDEFVSATKGKYIVIQSKHTPTDIVRRGGHWPSIWIIWNTDKSKAKFFDITDHFNLLALGYIATETSGHYDQPIEMLFEFFMFNKKRGNKIYTSDKMPLQTELGPIFDEVRDNMKTVGEILNDTSRIYDPKDKKFGWGNHVAVNDTQDHGGRKYEYTIGGKSFTATYNVYDKKTVIKPGRGYVYPSRDSAFRLYSVSPKSQAMIGTAFTDNEALVNKAKKIIDTFYKTQNVKVK